MTKAKLVGPESPSGENAPVTTSVNNAIAEFTVQYICLNFFFAKDVTNVDTLAALETPSAAIIST